MVMFGALFVVPFYLTAIHVDAAAAGLQLAALPVALALVAPFAGRVMDRAGARRLTAAGMIVTALGLAALALAHGAPGRVRARAIAGAGLGAFTPANNAAVMGAAPRARAGTVGGLLNTIRGLGTALGVAVAGLVYGLAGDHAGAPAHAANAANAAQAAAGSAAHGLTVTLLVLAVVALASGLLLARLRPTPARAAQRRVAELPA